jgi:uncharacterized protein YggT (Ycf19 family)
MAAPVSLIHFISAISLLVILLSSCLTGIPSTQCGCGHRIIEPLLNPIRRILPQTGMIDFSPLVLLILVQVVEYILTRVLLSF